MKYTFLLFSFIFSCIFVSCQKENQLNNFEKTISRTDVEQRSSIISPSIPINNLGGVLEFKKNKVDLCGPEAQGYTCFTLEESVSMDVTINGCEFLVDMNISVCLDNSGVNHLVIEMNYWAWYSNNALPGNEDCVRSYMNSFATMEDAIARIEEQLWIFFASQYDYQGIPVSNCGDSPGTWNLVVEYYVPSCIKLCMRSEEGVLSLVKESCGLSNGCCRFVAGVCREDDGSINYVFENIHLITAPTCDLLIGGESCSNCFLDGKGCSSYRPTGG